MNILWFTNSSLVNQCTTGKYNGCGWVDSLKRYVSADPNNYLSVVYINGPKFEKKVVDNVSVYVLARPSLFKKILKFIASFINSSKLLFLCDKELLCEGHRIIEKVKPDLIHVWGFESVFCMLPEYTSIPKVIYIQGILNPCYCSFLPPFFTWSDFYKFRGNNPIAQISQVAFKHFFYHSAIREKISVSNNKFFIGRTDWDCQYVMLNNKDANYYRVNEVMRPQFYNDSNRIIPEIPTIVSTISSTVYKGMDVILKTAYLLKYLNHLHFTWKVYGCTECSIFSKVVKIAPKDVNIELCGVASADQLVDSMSNATLYMHPSYIENSPNSICEAQLLGLPIIATNVGGVSSFIEHGKSGFLVPPNDPYSAAFYINMLVSNMEMNETMGEFGKNEALIRNNPQRVVDQLFSSYNEIVKNNSH